MVFPAQHPILVRDNLDIATLGSYLRSSTRLRPVAVLTVAPGQQRPFVDAQELWTSMGGAVDVVTIGGDHLTRALTDLLQNELAGVYRGACRVYPPGEAWESDPRSVPLLMGRDAAEITSLPHRVLAEAKKLVARPPVTSGSPATGTAPKPTPAPVPRQRPVLRHHLTTSADAAALGEHLRWPGRTRPVVVLTRATGAAAPFADFGLLTQDLNGLAEVYEIATPQASWALSSEVPDGCQVYGGAGRVYPVGTAWLDDRTLAPLRFAYSEADTAIITEKLRSDAFRMAASSGQLSVKSSPEKPHSSTGVVAGIAGNRALVQGPGGAIVGVLWPELVDSGLLAEQLFAKGMKVTGPTDPDSRRIDVRGMRRDADEALTGLTPGTTILTHVERVDAQGCVLSLFPGVTATLEAADVALPGVDPRSVVAPGDVVAAYYAGRTEAGEFVLSLLDAEEPAAAVQPPSVLHGGPPWLSWRAIELAAAPATHSLEQGPHEEPTDEFSALQREKRELVKLLYRRDARIAALEDELRAARSQFRQAGRRMAKRGPHAVLPAEALFEDPYQQLRFDVDLMWAYRTLPSEKPSLPLATWNCGREFIATLTTVEGISREKIVEVIVDVLTGRDTELASRELHQLRTGQGGDDPYRTRADGATCWRVSLQINTPGARRLHYWRLNDGSIELSSIRVHDDFRP